MQISLISSAICRPSTLSQGTALSLTSCPRVRNIYLRFCAIKITGLLLVSNTLKQGKKSLTQNRLVILRATMNPQGPRRAPTQNATQFGCNLSNLEGIIPTQSEPKLPYISWVRVHSLDSNSSLELMHLAVQVSQTFTSNQRLACSES